MISRRANDRAGFTLMELLIGLGIIGIISAIVLVAINPLKHLGDARGVSRNVYIREYENALQQYVIDGGGVSGVPNGIGSAVEICQETVTPPDCSTAGGYNLRFLSGTYIVNLPVDPNETGSTLTGFFLYRDGAFYKVCNKTLDATCGP